MAFESPSVCPSDAGTESEHRGEYMQFAFLTSSCQRRLLAASEATIN